MIATLTRESIAQYAWELYERNIKPVVEPEHHGEYLVLDVESGGYEIDGDEVAVMLRAAEKFPHGRRFGLRIGYPTMGRLGAENRPSRPMRLVES